MSRMVGGWMALIAVLATGAWLEMTTQGGEHIYLQESGYAFQADTAEAANATVTAQR